MGLSVRIDGLKTLPSLILLSRLRIIFSRGSRLMVSLIGNQAWGVLLIPVITVTDSFHRDFNAPVTGLRDTSAGTIVASGLLYLIEQEPSYKSKYLQRAINLINNTTALSQSPPAVYIESPFSVTNIGFNAFLSE